MKAPEEELTTNKTATGRCSAAAPVLLRKHEMASVGSDHIPTMNDYASALHLSYNILNGLASGTKLRLSDLT